MTAPHHHGQRALTLAEEREASRQRRDTAFQEVYRKIRFSDDPYVHDFRCGKLDPNRVKVP